MNPHYEFTRTLDAFQQYLKPCSAFCAFTEETFNSERFKGSLV